MIIIGAGAGGGLARKRSFVGSGAAGPQSPAKRIAFNLGKKEPAAPPAAATAKAGSGEGGGGGGGGGEGK